MTGPRESADPDLPALPTHLDMWQVWDTVSGNCLRTYTSEADARQRVIAEDDTDLEVIHVVGGNVVDRWWTQAAWLKERAAPPAVEPDLPSVEEPAELDVLLIRRVPLLRDRYVAYIAAQLDAGPSVEELAAALHGQGLVLVCFHDSAAPFAQRACIKLATDLLAELGSGVQR